MTRLQTVVRWAGPILWLTLALPPVRHALESTLTLQMLVQIPLLALVGWWLRPFLPDRAVKVLNAWNRGGISGLLLASFAAMITRRRSCGSSWRLTRSSASSRSTRSRSSASPARCR